MENGGNTNLETGDLVTSGKVRGVRRATLRRGTHTVLVVLADEDSGEVPELSLHEWKIKNKKKSVTDLPG